MFAVKFGYSVDGICSYRPDLDPDDPWKPAELDHTKLKRKSGFAKVLNGEVKDWARGHWALHDSDWCTVDDIENATLFDSKHGAGGFVRCWLNNHESCDLEDYEERLCFDTSRDRYEFLSFSGYMERFDIVEVKPSRAVQTIGGSR